MSDSEELAEARAALRARLQQIERLQPRKDDGLYVVTAPDVSSDGPIAAFRDEGLADALCTALNNWSAEVYYEPPADNDPELLHALVEQYCEEEAW